MHGIASVRPGVLTVYTAAFARAYPGARQPKREQNEVIGKTNGSRRLLPHPLPTIT
jgi:hypothetical protein